VKRFRVEFSRAFDDDLERYEALLADYVTADRIEIIAEAIFDACRRLETAPVRGSDWGHVRPGLRTLPALGRGTIIYAVDEKAAVVTMLGWWWRGAPISQVIERYR
jgi:hypothetical protein